MKTLFNLRLLIAAVAVTAFSTGEGRPSSNCIVLADPAFISHNSWQTPKAVIPQNLFWEIDQEF